MALEFYGFYPTSSVAGKNGFCPDAEDCALKDPSRYLPQAIKEFDRCLNKEFLATLEYEEASLILAKIELFYRLVETWSPRELRNTSEPLGPMTFDTSLTADNGEQDYFVEYMIVVGCRLCADLNEKVLLRMLDILDASEQEAETLYQQLRGNFKERHQASHLLKKAQHIRNLTVETTESMGLGVIL